MSSGGLFLVDELVVVLLTMMLLLLLFLSVPVHLVVFVVGIVDVDDIVDEVVV